jgi:HK97 family phage portal protein
VEPGLLAGFLFCPAGGGTIALDSLARRRDSGLVLRAEPGLVRRQALAQPTSPSDLFAELARFSSPSTGLQPPARFDQLLKRFGSSVWVYAAVYQRAVDQACLPLKVLREAGEHREPVEPTHPLKVLLEGVNPVMTWFDLVVLNSINLDLTGNDFWLFFGGPDGLPREIWPLSPKWVTVVPDPERFVAGYLVRPAGGEAFRFLPLGPDTGGTGIVHFKRPDPDNYHYGMGALRPAWGAALTDEAATEYRHAFYKNSARPDGILTSDQPMGPSAVQQIREQWQEIFQGPSRAYRVAVMSGNLKWQSITVPPIDVGIVKDRELSRQDLIVAFQVSLAVLGIETGDVGRREEQIRFYYERSVKPAVIQRLGTLGERLLPLYGEALHLEADWSGVRVLQEDEERKARVEQALLASGATVNEIRARRSLPKSTHPLADVPLVSGNLVPIDQVGFQAAGGLLGLSAAPPVAKLFRQGTPAGEAERAALWEALDAKALAHERPFHAGVMRAFRATWERMGALLREGVVPETAVTEAMTTLKGLLRRHAEAQLPTILETGWDRAVDLVLARQRRGKGVLDIAFSLAIPFLAEYLRLRPVRYGDLIAATLSGEFRELLGELANQGASIDQMAQAIADRFDAISEARARLIARTEVIAASNLGTLTAYRESGEVAAQEWLTARDERVRPSHQDMDGTVMPLGEPFRVGPNAARVRFPGDPEGPPEEIINCFLPGTIVSGRFVAGLEAQYAGPAREIVTARGHRLAVTPNHPILTPEGWLPAHALRQGDQLFSDRRDVLQASRQGDPHHHDGPAPIEDVFQALAAHRRPWPTMVGALDLHGDARWVEDQIHVVGTHRLLGLNGHMMIPQPVNQSLFRRHDPRQVPHARPGGPDLDLQRHALSPAGGPRGAALALDSGAVLTEVAPLEPLGLGLAAEWDVVRPEDSLDHVSRDRSLRRQLVDAHARPVPRHDRVIVQRHAVARTGNGGGRQSAIDGREAHAAFIRQLLDRSTGLIAPDEVVEVREFEFAGHVYDLQTDGGWMIAQGIVSSNCRCVALPVLTGEE